ncbi:hypothetical protein [Phenylobacterium sp.]|uniref:hypothetical protein n=1 Tax=Phenylobacterium sp. TaxID=1871053 RepID=UPI00286C53A8|nr:hypothetical protein [Phenylobacterium sp.]
MPPADSALDATMIARARRLLKGPEVRERVWPALCAAAFAASTALALATAMILAPPVTTTPIVERTR